MPCRSWINNCRRGKWRLMLLVSTVSGLCVSQSATHVHFLETTCSRKPTGPGDDLREVSMKAFTPLLAWFTDAGQPPDLLRTVSKLLTSVPHKSIMSWNRIGGIDRFPNLTICKLHCFPRFPFCLVCLLLKFFHLYQISTWKVWKSRMHIVHIN